MATTTPLAYNPSLSPISGTTQVGQLAVGTANQDYSISPGGVTWWMGPDEDLGYVIAVPVSGNTQPTNVPDDALFLSTTYKGGDIVLYNNNQTAAQIFGYQQSVLGVNQIGATDKVMFSVLCTLAEPGVLADSHFVGVGYTTMNYSGNPYGGFPGNDNQSMGYGSNGTIWYNGGVYQGGLQTWGNNDIIDIVVDNNTNDLWVRVNGGNWNNNPSANPATGSNGIETIGGPFYPVLCPAYEGTMIVQNTSSYSIPSGYNFLGNVSASVGFFRSEDLTDNSFIGIAEYVANEYGSPQTFTSASDASDWLTNNGFWNTFIPVTPTPTPTNGVTQTPTNTPTNTPTPTPTSTNTPTPSPTNTPTPTTSPIPVTGFGYNLVVLPYAPPTSGNTIFPRFTVTGDTSGVTTPNTFNVNGVYWNAIDNLSVNRTSYYSGMTGTSVTAYFTQNGDTAIYSGSSTAFTFEGPPGQQAFNYNPQVRPGQLILVQSASTNFVTGQTVNISYIVN
jgi:hypothetical protein